MRQFWHRANWMRLFLMGLWIVTVLAVFSACDSKKQQVLTGASATAASAQPSSAAPPAVLKEEPLASKTSSGSDQEINKADPSRLSLIGNIIQGGLVRAKVEKGTRKVKFPGHKLIISPQGEFLIAFFRNAPQKQKLIITFPDGAVLEHHFDIEQRNYETDKIDNLPEHMVKLNLERRKKLHAANKRIDKLRLGYTKMAHYQNGFVWPALGKLTSRYGQKRIFNGVDGGIHWGVDIAVPVGTAVKAPAGGRVIFAEKNVPLAGHTLVLDHGHGLTSSFLHLRNFRKKVGDDVKQGETLATVGMTGRTNGAHLDWRMNLFARRIDPELLVPPMPQRR